MNAWLFKVLTGAQAGAAAEIAPDVSYLIGADDQADIVLRDSRVPRHLARARLTPDGMRLEVLDDGLGHDGARLARGTTLDLGPFSLVACGACWCAFGPADAPWPQLAIPAEMPAAQATTAPAAGEAPQPSEPHQAAADAASDGAAAPPAPSPSTATDGDTPLPSVSMAQADEDIRGPARGNGGPPFWAFALSAVVLGGGLLALQLTNRATTADAGGAVSISADPAVLSRWLDENGFSQLQVEPGTPPILTGVVATRVDRRALAEALRSNGLVAQNRVVAEDAVLAAAQTVLDSFGAGLDAVAIGDGTLAVRGEPPADLGFQAIAARLRTDLPGAFQIEDQTTTSTDTTGIDTAAPRASTPPDLRIRRIGLQPVPHVVDTNGHYYLVGAEFDGGYRLTAITLDHLLFMRGDEERRFSLGDLAGG